MMRNSATRQEGKRSDLNSFFAHKVCMNLDRRPERWARMKERFAKHKITDVVRFSAVDGERVSIPPGWQASAGAYGCLQSNLSIIQMAREARWPAVLIFDDDVVFDEDLDTRFPQFMAQLPRDWDMALESGHSDTCGRAINSWWLKESLPLVGREMDLIQSRTVLVIPHRDRTPERLGVRNLFHVMNGYARVLQGVTIAVVEQDEALSLASGLPAYCCDYIPIRDGGPLNRGMCFNEAVRRLGADKEFYVFVDRDIEAGWEVRANLRKCLHYDFVSPFDQLIDLTEEDTGKIIQGEQIDGSRYTARPRVEICAEFCTFTRAAFERVGGWDESGGHKSDDIQSRKARQMLSVFESPGWGYRLFSGDSEDSSIAGY